MGKLPPLVCVYKSVSFMATVQFCTLRNKGFANIWHSELKEVAFGQALIGKSVQNKITASANNIPP